MASLTMEKKDWDTLRAVLESIPAENRDADWTQAFSSIERVTDRVRLEGQEWSRLKKVLERIPDHDKSWKMAYDSVKFVCEMILDARDMLKDPRRPDDQGHRDAEGIWP